MIIADEKEARLITSLARLRTLDHQQIRNLRYWLNSEKRISARTIVNWLAAIE